MVEYLRIPCPNCQHVLRVRKQYIGIEVVCTRCDHSFIVEEPHEEIATSKPDDATTGSRDAYEKQITELKNDLDRVREDFARVASENAHAAEQLQKLTERYAEREARLSELEHSLNESQEVIRQSEALIRLESIPESIDLSQENLASEPGLPQLAQDIRRLRAERNQLLDAATELERELEQLRAELDRVAQTSHDTYAQQQAAYQTVKQELESMRRNWDMERETLQQQIAHEQSRHQALEEQIQLLESASRENSAAPEFDRVCRDLEQTQQRASQLEMELASLRNANTEPNEAVDATNQKQQIDDLTAQLQDALDENQRLRMTIGKLGISFG